MKKIISISLPVLFFCFVCLTSTAQTAGDYRSKQTGAWNLAATWQQFDGVSFVNATAAPSSTDGQINILTAHNITVSTPVTADQLIVDAGGTITIASSLTLADGTGDDLTANGTILYNNGIIAGPGNVFVAAGGNLTFATTGLKNISANITNNGTINWQDGNINFYSGTPLITNNGTFAISGNNSIVNNGGIGTLVNTGTITKTSTGTSLFILLLVTNSGTINCNGGTLQTNTPTFTNTGNLSFNGGDFANYGTFNHNTGSVISGTGSFNNKGTLNLNIDLAFPATLVFPTTGTIGGAGNLTVNNDIIISATIGGTGALTINANIIWNSSGLLARNLIIQAANSLTISTTSTKNIAANITNNGTINWQDGNVYFSSGAPVIINNGTFTISGNNNIQNNGGNGTMLNAGTITKTSTGTSLLALLLVTNSGTIKGLGTIDMNSTTFNSNGIIAPGLSPGLLTLNSRQPLSANSTLAIEIFDGSGAGTGHDQLIRNSNLTLTGTLTVTETGTVPDGTYTIINLTAGTVSGSFATTHLPAGYTLQVNATNVQLVKTGVLPLTFISFTAQKTPGNKVQLQWITANEINTLHFEIERSKNGIEFSKIGSVEAKNTNGTHTYSFEDGQPLSSSNFYRLKQIDIDGRFTYSPIVKILFDEFDKKIVAFPNPAKDVITISSSKKQEAVITTATGRFVSKIMLLNGSQTINISTWANGIYFIKSEAEVIKIIKE